MTGCRCSLPHTPTSLRNLATTGVGEDEFSAIVVEAINRPRPHAKLATLLATFVPPADRVGWFHDVLTDPALRDRVFARLLTGDHKSDIVIAARTDTGWRPAAVVEVKNKPVMQCRPFPGPLETQWQAQWGSRLDPHVGMWSKNDLDAVPQTDTYALLPFAMTGCPRHPDPRQIESVADRDTLAWRLLLNRDVPAGAIVGESVTEHLWQTLPVAELAATGTLGWAHDEWDAAFADLCRSRIESPEHKGQLDMAVVAAVTAAALTDSTAADRTAPATQTPTTAAAPAPVAKADAKYLLWNHDELLEALPHSQLADDEYQKWAYTCVRTTRKWRYDDGSREKVPYRDLPHRFQLRADDTTLRRLRVDVGVTAADRLGWENNDEVLRHWPTAAFPAFAGHLVVSTVPGPDGELGPWEPLTRHLVHTLNESVFEFAARGHDVHGTLPAPKQRGGPTAGPVRGAWLEPRVAAWVTFNPVATDADGELGDCTWGLPERTSHHGWCGHRSRARLSELLALALPVIARFDSLARGATFSHWAAHQR